eukprot:gb/GEZN01003420.1/.p1 GENE.gb/GEZN01003420.1/~~gb/GEZN01003420.1/.p1  ORF type:complete len:589 (+),score=106.80 gb/GEZN01003420.1/:36-1802(+)
MLLASTKSLARIANGIQTVLRSDPFSHLSLTRTRIFQTASVASFNSRKFSGATVTQPVILCILDGVGWGKRDHGDAVFLAKTPVLDKLMAEEPWTLLTAHGTAVGMPSDEDMGNSEVGHNAMGAGRIFAQGATLVEKALKLGKVWESESWQTAVKRCGSGSGTLHFLILLSDGGVHSNIQHLLEFLEAAQRDKIKKVRVHALTDGRDVEARSALKYLERLNKQLAVANKAGMDYAVATGGGRMNVTMDRYEADWQMVKKGWDLHVGGVGRRFKSAEEAVSTMYKENPKVDDQWLPPFVCGDYKGMQDGDSVILLNYRGDRAIEISRAFEEGPEFDAIFKRTPTPQLSYSGMMEYDGDTHVPKSYLVSPPAINDTVGDQLAIKNLKTYAISETQKFGHVTYFFNGNSSAVPKGEVQFQIGSDNVPFNQAPIMKAPEITQKTISALQTGKYDHLRLNLANGDMVGHTGDLPATVTAVESVDACVGQLAEAAKKANAILLVTADHGNADEMLMVKKGKYVKDKDGNYSPCTSHSLNPVPFIIYDPAKGWTTNVSATKGKSAGSIARIGATLLELCGVSPPKSYLPSLVQRK